MVTTGNETWYTDSGATNHVTSGLENLSFRSSYQGGDCVSVGNGTSLEIKNSGSSSFKQNQHTFHLNHILHVLHISTNLLSVHQFCKDNDCSVIFTDSHFLVKDNQSGKVRFHGRSKNGLYPLRISCFHTNKVGSSSPKVHFTGRVSSNIWHHRLKHPAKPVMLQILSRQKSLLHGLPSLSLSCASCQMGKSNKLPFSLLASITNAPLQLVHSDV